MRDSLISDKRKIRNVVFDLGGVMIDYNPRSFVEALGYDKETTEGLLKAIFESKVWAEMDRGKYMDYRSALDAFVAESPRYEDNIREFFCEGWMEVYKVKPDTERILYDWVYDQGYDIYILTNYAADGFAYIEKKYPFFRKAKGYIVSAREKCVKPEPEIYMTLLDRFGLRAEETVFFDDIPANVRGACNVGIHGILFTDPEEARNRLLQLG